MSRELLSPGNDFSVAWGDRGFGSRPVDVLNVSGADGTIAFANAKMTVNGVTQLGSATVTVGAKVTDTVTTVLQLKDGAGNNIAGKRRVTAWVSATAGATSVGTDTTGLTTAVTVGIAIYVPVANLVYECVTDATGKLTMTLTDGAGTTTRFLNYALEDGTIISSTAIITT